MYDLDHLYYKAHPDFRAFSIFSSVSAFPNTYLNYFSEAAFEKKMAYIVGFYKDFNGDLERGYPYFTKDDMDGFVESAVCEIQGKLTAILHDIAQYVLVYATNNPAKLESMRTCLEPLGIELIGLKDVDTSISEVCENGKTPLENARTKALAYYKALRRPVFACDSGLYIDGLPEDEQPGVHVRRVNGKRLSDNEITGYYAGIAAKLGGKAVARYRNAICLVLSDGEIYEHFGDDISGEAFYLTSKPHSKRNEGFPLDCISIHIESGEYYYNRIPGNNTSTAVNGFQTFFEKTLHSRNEVVK